MKKYWKNIRNVPDGFTFIIDKNSIGEMVVKKELTIEVQELIPEDFETVIAALPNLQRDQSSKKIRILTYEVVHFNLRNTNAIHLVQTKTLRENAGPADQ